MLYEMKVLCLKETFSKLAHCCKFLILFNSLEMHSFNFPYILTLLQFM